jgi:hypothetical protein
MALLICAPLLASRGFALTHDMVFVPRQPFKAGWLGLDGSVPRAVPGDAVVSGLSMLVPGDLLQKALLLGLLAAAGGGAAAAVPARRLPGRLAAATLYVWNAYVFERLAMGHWALLCGYAALPWIVVASRLIRQGRVGGWAAMAVAVAAAALSSPTGGVLATIACWCLVIGRDRFRTLCAIGICLALNLPWLVPSLLYRGGIPADRTGVEVFAAHADTPYGVLGSLLSLGGIWNADVVPPGRDSWILAGFMVALCAAGILGLRWGRTHAGEIAVSRLVLAAAIGLLLAALPALPGGRTLMEWVDVHLPGAGLLRDSQKWVALLALAEAIGLAALVTYLGERWRRADPHSAWWLAAGGVVLPVVVMPGLAWGAGDRLAPVAFPRDWSVVSHLLMRADNGGEHGDVAVLPWSIYRQYSWNGERPVLDPAPRYFPGDVVIADTLVVGPRIVGGEDPRAAAIGRLLRSRENLAAGLRRLGIGLVVVERHTPGFGQDAHLDGRLVFDGRWLQLWVLGPPAHGPTVPGDVSRAAMISGDLVAVATLLGCVLILIRRPFRRYTGNPPRPEGTACSPQPSQPLRES